jgi:hypothetical protein
VGALVVAEAVSDVIKLDVAASEDAVVEVGQAVGSANGHVVQRTVEAVGVSLAGSVVLLADTLAADNAVVGIGLAIDTANGLVEIVGASAALVGIAGASVSQLDLLAGHETGVLILNTVLTADRSTGNAVAGAAATVLAKSGAFALKTAGVVVFLTLSAADGSDS